MAIRAGYSIGRTTGESSLPDQLSKFKPRTTAPPEDPTAKLNRAPNPAHESLKEKCIQVIVDNFERMPVRDVLPPPQMAEITGRLSTSLDPVIGAKYVYNENYWKRCCVEKYGWHNCVLAEHGLLWKQLYFEKSLREKLEDFDPETEDTRDLYAFIDACSDYIFTVGFNQLPRCVGAGHCRPLARSAFCCLTHVAVVAPPPPPTHTHTTAILTWRSCCRYCPIWPAWKWPTG